jgi:hypothetical protein
MYHALNTDILFKKNAEFLVLNLMLHIVTSSLWQVTAYNDPVRFGTYQPNHQQQQHMFKMVVTEGVAHFMSQIPLQWVIFAFYRQSAHCN